MHRDTIDPEAYARRWKTLAVLSLSLLIIGLDNTVLNVALPTLQTHFSASGSTLQWIVDAYLLAFAGVLLTMGTLGDRFGRKRALQWGLGLFGVASVLAAFAQSADQLIVLRAAMGIGGAMIMPATLSVIMDVFPREERGKAIGIWSAIAGVGIGLGPFVGGLLLEFSSWSAVFWLNVPIVVVALVAGLRLVPESRDPAPGAFDLRGATLSIAMLVTLVYGIIEATPRGWTDPLVLGCFVAAALLALAFVAWERRVPAPMLPLDFFRDPRFTVASVGVGLVFFAMMGSVFAFTQYLQFAHGYSALEAGAAMLPLALGLVIGSGASNRLVGSAGRSRVIAGGLIGVAAVLSTSLAWTPEMAPVLLGLVTFGLALSMGAAMAPATASVMSAVPEARAGVGSAMSDVTRQVGGALGVAVIGSIIGTAYSRGMSGEPDAAADSVGAAHAVAGQAGGSAGRELADTAGRAFTDALGIGLTAAAAVALAGAVLVLLRLPDGRAVRDDRSRPPPGCRGPAGRGLERAPAVGQRCGRVGERAGTRSVERAGGQDVAERRSVGSVGVREAAAVQSAGTCRAGGFTPTLTAHDPVQDGARVGACGEDRGALDHLSARRVRPREACHEVADRCVFHGLLLCPRDRGAVGFQRIQAPAMIGQLCAHSIVLGATRHAAVDLVLRSLASKAEPYADVVGQADLVALRAGRDLVVLGLADAEGDRHERHGSLAILHGYGLTAAARAVAGSAGSSVPGASGGGAGTSRSVVAGGSSDTHATPQRQQASAPLAIGA